MGKYVVALNINVNKWTRELCTRTGHLKSFFGSLESHVWPWHVSFCVLGLKAEHDVMDALILMYSAFLATNMQPEVKNIPNMHRTNLFPNVDSKLLAQFFVLKYAT